MNSVVRLVVSVLWVVAYLLIDAEVDHSRRAMLGLAESISSGTVAVTPAHRRIRHWLARRLTSPPADPRLGTA